MCKGKLLGLTLAVLLVTTGPTCLPDRAPVARFDLSNPGGAVFGLLPFPNDLFLDEDAHPDVPGLTAYFSVPGAKILHDGLASADGFGTSAAVFFPVRGSISEASLTHSIEPGTPSSVILVDVDRNSPERGMRKRIEVRYDGDARMIVLLPYPGMPLRPATTYAALLTTGVVGVDGALTPDEDFLVVRDDLPTDDPLLLRAKAIYQPVLSFLESAGIVEDRTEIAVASIFTTQTIDRDLVAIADFLAGEPAPQARWSTFRYRSAEELDRLFGVPEENLPGLDNPGGVAHQNIGGVALGSYLSPDFRDVESGRFVFVQGRPVVQGTAEVPFVLVVPNRPPPSEAGYPVVVFQHGIGGSRVSALSVANDLAAIGVATAAFTAVSQGERFDPTDVIFNLTGAEGSDGFSDNTTDSSTAFFANFIDLPRVREHFRQSVADGIMFLRMIRNPEWDLSPLGDPPIDRSRIALLGDSLGTMIGGDLIAVAPEIRGGILNVAGGGLANLLFLSSPVEFGPNVETLARLYGFDPEAPLDRFSLFGNLVQSVLDPADPINFAPFVIARPLTLTAGTAPRRDILQIMVHSDEVVPNISNEALARALGLDLLSPALTEVPFLASTPSPAAGNLSFEGEGVTGVLVQYAPADHGGNMTRQWGEKEYYPGFPFPPDQPQERFPKFDTPIPIRNPNGATLEQIKTFLETLFFEEAPRVVTTEVPRPDFDDDGVLDDADADPYDPSVQ